MRLGLLALLAVLVCCMCLASAAEQDQEPVYEWNDKHTFYELLGVGKDASERDLKKAFRKRAAIFHPDKHTDDESRKVAEQRFIKLAFAYETLSDDNKRASYDESLSRGYTDFEAYMQKRDYRSTYNEYMDLTKEEAGIGLSVIGIFTAVCVVVPGYQAVRMHLRARERKKALNSEIRQRQADEQLKEKERVERAQQKKVQEALNRQLLKERQDQWIESIIEQSNNSASQVHPILGAAPSTSTTQTESQLLVQRANRPWTVTELSALSKSLAKIPGGVSNRWTLITDAVNKAGRNEGLVGEWETKDIVIKARELHPDSLHQQIRMASVPSSSSSSSSAVPAPTTAKASDAATNVKSSPVASASSSKEQNGANGGVVEDDSAAAEPEWTAEQQKQLEQALRRYPADMIALDENGDKIDRWRLISLAVPGRTRKQCIQRFKEIKTIITKMKAAPPQQKAE